MKRNRLQVVLLIMLLLCIGLAIEFAHQWNVYHQYLTNDQLFGPQMYWWKQVHRMALGFVSSVLFSIIFALMILGWLVRKR